MNSNTNFEQSLQMKAQALESTVYEEWFKIGSRDIAQNWSEGNACCLKCDLDLVERVLDVSSERAQFRGWKPW